MKRLLVFLGPPGAGKGTQAARIAERFSLAHISTGDMLRKEVREGTKLGQDAKRVMDLGELVPDAIILAMVKSRLKEPDCSSGALLDGFPRTLEQAKALCDMMKVDGVVNIAVPNERIVDRLGKRRFCETCKHTAPFSDCPGGVCPKCGAQVVLRDDDRPETVRRRLEVYDAQTKPLIEFFEEKGILVSVDGDRGVDDVFESIALVLSL